MPTHLVVILTLATIGGVVWTVIPVAYHYLTLCPPRWHDRWARRVLRHLSPVRCCLSPDHTYCPGHWRDSQHGRNVMALGLSLGAVIDASVLRALGLLSEVAAVVLAFILWPSLVFVGLHRFALLWRDQHPHPAPEED